MINTSEEFISLRETNDPRSALDEAPLAVWQQIVDLYPEMQEWVVRNKTIPLEILEYLVTSPDYRVRRAIAEKRKCSHVLFEKLASDPCNGIKLTVALNRKTPVYILQRLALDECKEVSVAAHDSIIKSQQLFG